MVVEHLREGRLVPLFGARHPADFAYVAVAPEASAERPRIRLFVDRLLEEAARNAAWTMPVV